MIRVMSSMVDTEECECCNGDGLHMTEAEFFGMEGTVIRLCNTCNGTGRVVGFCPN